MNDNSGIEPRLRTIEDKLALGELVSGYAYAVGQGDGEGIADLFCEDGAFVAPSREVRGCENLRRFFASIATRGTTVPSVTNCVFEISGDHAKGTSTLIVLSALATRELLCGFYNDDCVRVDGRWRFHSRRLTAYFRWT